MYAVIKKIVINTKYYNQTLSEIFLLLLIFIIIFIMVKITELNRDRTILLHPYL